MTTAFELSSSAASASIPWSISQVGDPYSVYNSQSRAFTLRASSAASHTAAQQDTAAFSATSVLLAETESGSRAERIASLRRNIADGTYSVSSWRVAGGILQSLR